jgi:DNA-binding transcriptional LysR family regulator
VYTSISSIEIRHLRYFLGVAEEGSFTRAATLLHTTQPTLSTQIRQLERRVGGELFVRNQGHVQLTDAGRALLDFAYSAVGAIHRGVAAVQAAGSGATTTLTVIAGRTVDVAPLFTAVGKLRRGDPRIRLDLSRADSLERRVVNGEADAALLRAPVSDPALWQGVVSTEPTMAVLAVDHPLARRSRPTVSDVRVHEAMELAEGAVGLGRVTSSPEELLTDVVNGRCVGILPSCLVPDVESGLAVRPVRGLKRATTVIVRRRTDHTDAVVALTALMTAKTNHAVVVRRLAS